MLAFCSVPLALIAGGTVGYHWIEGWSWFYAFYVTVITLTSIGYGEAQPLSDIGRVFTMILAIGGISTFALAATQLLGLIVTGALRDSRNERRMGKRIDSLQQQVIVCGYGDVGRHVCADLLAAGVPVVVVERRDGPLAAAAKAGALALSGDATTDATLEGAGIARARALIAAAGTDAENVLITMTARLLRSELTIVARVEEEATASKLTRAGATLTVSPYAIAGGRMARAILRPAVSELIEGAGGGGGQGAGEKGHPDLRLEEKLVAPGGPLDGETVGSCGLGRAGTGLILVAIKHRDGRLAFDPGDDSPVVAGDILITVRCRAMLEGTHGTAFSR
ncbi:MAG TPA: potassium channel family protein [Polyangia bacterium]